MSRQFGQNGQTLHENYKINIFGTKHWGKMEGQANVLVSRGVPHSGKPCILKAYIMVHRNTKFCDSNFSQSKGRGI